MSVALFTEANTKGEDISTAVKRVIRGRKQEICFTSIKEVHRRRAAVLVVKWHPQENRGCQLSFEMQAPTQKTGGGRLDHGFWSRKVGGCSLDVQRRALCWTSRVADCPAEKWALIQKWGLAVW